MLYSICTHFYCLFPADGSVKTDLMGSGANSTLFVARVNKSDSGNYSCFIRPDQFYTVAVHVLNGKYLLNFIVTHARTLIVYFIRKI